MGMFCSSYLMAIAQAGRQIKIGSSFNETVHFHIQGAGAGGCDVDVPANGGDEYSCDCIWGTLNYQVEVTVPGQGFHCSNQDQSCGYPHIPGNCYGHSYACSVEPTGWPVSGCEVCCSQESVKFRGASKDTLKQ